MSDGGDDDEVVKCVCGCIDHRDKEQCPCGCTIFEEDVGSFWSPTCTGPITAGGQFPYDGKYKHVPRYP